MADDDTTSRHVDALRQQLADVPLVHSIAEAAEALRTSRDTVERLILRGELAYVRLNSRNKVIPHGALVAFIEANTETAA